MASSVSVRRRELSARESLLSSSDSAAAAAAAAEATLPLPLFKAPDRTNSVNRKRRAERMPHQRAGAMDRSRATMRKGCQRRGTPRATATRGWRSEWSRPPLWWLLLLFPFPLPLP